MAPCGVTSVQQLKIQDDATIYRQVHVAEKEKAINDMELKCDNLHCE